MIVALLVLNFPRIIVDPSRFISNEIGMYAPLGFQDGDNVTVVGRTIIESDGTIYVSSQEMANETRTYHYAGKNTIIMICDQTGEQIATPSSNRDGK